MGKTAAWAGMSGTMVVRGSVGENKDGGEHEGGLITNDEGASEIVLGSSS